jgi:hypothetical protein
VIRAAFEELVAKAGVPCWAIFYENNSDDGTNTELMKWVSDAPADQVKVQCDKFTLEEELSRCAARTYDNKPCRMEQIAHARNKLLDMLVGEPRPPNPSFRDLRPPAKYVIMIDMDNPVPFPVNAILRCIARDPDGFDALVCNGLNPMGYMYDTYAYRDAQFPFGPEIMREAFWSGHHQYYVQTAIHNKTMFHNRQMKHNPAMLPYIPIASGFNGMCIFRREALMGAKGGGIEGVIGGAHAPLLRYSAVPTAEMNAEYKSLNCIPPLSKNAKTHADGASVGMYLFPNNNDHDNDTANHKNNNDTNHKNSIFYFHNSGYNFPVVCEHVPFFAGMRAHNRRRIYLCTDLVWNWI